MVRGNFGAIMDKVWEIKDPSAYLKGGKRKTRTRPLAEEKDPAKAYSRSIIVWGSGQNYNGEFGKGLAFILLMIIVYLGAGLAVFFRNALLQLLREEHILLSDAFFACEVLLLLVLLFWFGNAGNAYHTAAKTRRSRFSGIPSKAVPALCSLLLPGWGQFLNGQPFKGSILSGLWLLGIFSFISIPAVILAWPLLEATESRFIIEAIFVISVIGIPLWLIVWLYGVYDALRVSLDEYKKEPLWERIKAANNRRRTAGLVKGVFPWIGRTFALALILTFCVIIVYYYFPKRYYVEWLTLLRRDLTGLGMTILPELLSKLLS